MFKTKKDILEVETYDLEYYMIKWLNEHLKAYLKYASNVIDLEYHKFKHKGKILTEKQVIERLIEITDFIIKDNNYFHFDNITKLTDEMYDLLKKAGRCIWW